MKRIISFSLAFIMVICLCGCSGNFSRVNLNEPIAIPENGTVEKSVIDKIKDENAIAVFEGNCDEIKYEWTIFGSDITVAKDINLSVSVTKASDGLNVKFTETDDFGFPALLSIHLNEKWNSRSATAYKDSSAVYSVSLTGSKTSILNISVNKMVSDFVVLPDSEENTGASAPTAEQGTNKTTQNESVTVQNDSYLSDSKDSNGAVFTENETTEKSKNQNDKQNQNKNDGYLSDGKEEDNRVYSDGKSTIKDKYDTDPIPEGKPMPVEPENQEINNKKAYTCTFSIECSTILNNLPDLDPEKRELVPSDGVILAPVTVTFYEGESVYDVLQRVCKEKGIHMEASWTPVYNSVYVEGINNLYEFDCGALSGWMYAVDGWYPNYGCSRYQLKDGEKVEWRYTCDLGRDVGCDWLAGTQ